jgi:hypothetical protein
MGFCKGSVPGSYNFSSRSLADVMEGVLDVSVGGFGRLQLQLSDWAAAKVPCIDATICTASRGTLSKVPRVRQLWLAAWLLKNASHCHAYTLWSTDAALLGISACAKLARDGFINPSSIRSMLTLVHAGLFALAGNLATARAGSKSLWTNDPNRTSCVTNASVHSFFQRTHCLQQQR